MKNEDYNYRRVGEGKTTLAQILHVVLTGLGYSSTLQPEPMYEWDGIYHIIGTAFFQKDFLNRAVTIEENQEKKVQEKENQSSNLFDSNTHKPWPKLYRGDFVKFIIENVCSLKAYDDARLVYFVKGGFSPNEMITRDGFISRASRQEISDEMIARWVRIIDSYWE